MAPTTAHRSHSVGINKHNGKKRMAYLRWIHVFCPFWRCWFKVATTEGLRSAKSFWQSYLHGYLPHLRREDPIAAQRVVGWRPSHQRRVPRVTIFYGCANAFGSTKKEELEGAAMDITRERDRQLTQQRILNSCLHGRRIERPSYHDEHGRLFDGIVGGADALPTSAAEELARAQLGNVAIGGETALDGTQHHR